jgi:hypothetical protein
MNELTRKRKIGFSLEIGRIIQKSACPSEKWHAGVARAENKALKEARGGKTQ